MKSFYILLAFFLLGFDTFAQTCPSSVRVGTSCSCHSCTGTVDVVNYETYVKRVLPQEWLNCWGSQTNGMNSPENRCCGYKVLYDPKDSLHYWISWP